MGRAKRSISSGTTLILLFGGMAAIAVALLIEPTMTALRQLKDGERIVEVAQAGRAVFTALQNTRIQRGPTRVALNAEGPATAAFGASMEEARGKAAPAFERILQLCSHIDCTGGKPELFDRFPSSLTAWKAAQAEADAALKVPRSQRAAGLADKFNTVATDLIDRLEAMSIALGERIRMSDTTTAELMAIKQSSWLARDGLGLERTSLAEARGQKRLTPALDRKIADLRGRALAGWSLVRELSARPGLSAELLGLIRAAESEAFEKYEVVRKNAYEDVATNRVPLVSDDELNRASAVALDALTAVADATMRLAQQHAEQQRDSASRAVITRLALLAVILAIAGAGFVVVRNRVSRPLSRMTSVMLKVAGGETSILVPGSGRRDEIGAMARAVEVFRQGVVERRKLEEEAERLVAAAEAQKRTALSDMAQGFEAKISSLSEALVAASTRLEATADRMSATALQTAEESELLAKAASLAGGNVQTVAAATEELAASASEIGTQIERTASTALRAVEDVRATQETVTALSSAVEKIETVVALINDIAARTNLLALNATIEAARAGETGRGFAVVASEVKDLANQTIKATDEIATQIARLQQATAGAVSAVGGISTRIEEVHKVASSIAAAADEQQSATQEIARSVSQAAQGTDAVGSSVATVQNAAATTGSSAAEVLGSARDLARCSHELRQELRSFLASMQAA